MPFRDVISLKETTAGAQSKVDAHARANPHTVIKKSVTVNMIIAAGYAVYVPDELEIATGIEVEIGNGGILEIG